ncbi:MAG: hypothetical protein H6526_00855 [Actinobacteria bacterium]|nr:hypothetical protein [Actinomycetota bacterium]MCB0922461.1 hypothetical protein [Actinomycetota bacterium]MCB9413812.1 hypothetical protein [Actinomycetota bacterium]
MAHSVLVLMNTLASMEADEGEAAHVSPYAYGAVALGVLLLLLFVTTRLNVDR